MSHSLDSEKTGEQHSHAIFILNTITQTFKKKRKTIYTCFIDFSKAFDEVHHGLLWERLATAGLSSKILTILQSMYAQASSRICVNHEESKSFAFRRGIRQGCNLSPILFSLFINDLDQFLTDNNSGSIKLCANTFMSPAFHRRSCPTGPLSIRTAVLHQSVRQIL